MAPPLTASGAYVRSARCSYPLRTREPTGLLELDARAGHPELTLGDLFAVWGQPLSPTRLAGFRAPRGERVTAHLDGRSWPGDPRSVPLRRHAVVVLEVAGFVAAARQLPLPARFVTTLPFDARAAGRSARTDRASRARAPGALADADPPSDVLLLQDVYYPYQPPVAANLRSTLDKLVAQSQRAGYPVKVALVQSAVDLGAIPQLFGRPAAYAPFLEREIAFRTRGPLLAVMPAGIATANVNAKARQAIAPITVDRSQQSNGLVAAAIRAVPKMATASGHPVAEVPVPAASGSRTAGGGSSPLLVFGAPVLLVAIAALVAALRRRRDHDEEDDEPDARAEATR